MSEPTTKRAVVYSLPSLVDGLDLPQLFPQSQPLEVELGSGDASFLIQYAQAHPERNFIGVERLLGRIRKTERKSNRAGLSNVRAVRIESSYFVQYLLPPGSVTALHIYFPDPWPKRKHERHRLINEGFPNLAAKALAPEGRVYLRTDNPAYYAQMKEVFAASPHFQPIDTGPELAAILTDFERDFLARGIQTLRAAYQLSR